MQGQKEYIPVTVIYNQNINFNQANKETDPDINFFVECNAGFHIEEFRCTVSHRTLLGRNFLYKIK